MSNTWYTFSITIGGSSVFNGFFELVVQDNSIISVYNSTDLTTNLFQDDGDGGSHSGIVISGILDYIRLTSISPALDSQYNASYWYYMAGDNVLYAVDSEGNMTLVTYDNISYNVSSSPFNNVPCFNQGTKILCLNKEVEEYVPVQNLRKGDLVKTYLHGYKHIKEIGMNIFFNDPSNHRRCMYVMKKDKNADLVEDLTVTGDHSILVDVVSIEERIMLRKRLMSEEKIGQKKLVMSSISDKFEQIVNRDEYTYYHFCVEDVEKSSKKFGVWANGVLSEIPAADQFKSLDLQIV